MKNLKITILLSFLLMITSVNAQSNLSRFDEAAFQKEIKNDLKKMSLSSSQEASYKSILKKYFEQYQDFRDTEATSKQRDEKYKELEIQKDVEIKNLLKEEQYNSYIKIKEEREEMLRNRKPE
jgi:hypothetical protein